MMPRQVLSIAILALLVPAIAPRPAHAQGFVSPLIGYDFGGDSGCPEISDCDDKRANVGVSIGSFGALLGGEIELAYANDFFGDIPGVSSSVLTLMGNVMVAPALGFVRPYGLIGVGLIKSNVEFPDLFESDNNQFGWDIGGGLIVLFTEHVGVRGDIRYFHAFEDLEVLGISLGETKLDFGRAAGALVFSF
jgi:opacity protein-like surface antigen